MIVDSFSELPFIGPLPSTRERSSSIRLFGINFPDAAEDLPYPKVKDCASTVAKGSGGSDAASPKVDGGGRGGRDGGRRFECHYCGRNFPTSQARGGHHNAPTRERQQAKTAHLQSVYGFMGQAAPMGIDPRVFKPPLFRSQYSSSTVLSGARFYGAPGFISQPLQGTWRIQPVQPGALPPQLEGTAAPTFFCGDGQRVMSGMRRYGGGGITGLLLSSSSPAGIIGEEASKVKENLSLDLHL